MPANSKSKASSSTKKSPSTATNHSKPSPQYIPLSRSWPTDPASPHQHATGASQSTTGSQVTQQDMTPMQRWEHETLQQGYYTNVAEYDASYRTGGFPNGQDQNGGGSGEHNWSLMGDEKSERF